MFLMKDRQEADQQFDCVCFQRNDDQAYLSMAER